MISWVPSSRWLIASERISSSVITPPALRMTWASPSLRPRMRYTSRRASMQATTATCLAGGSGSGPEKVAEYSALLASSSSVTDTQTPHLRGEVGIRQRPRGQAKEALEAGADARPRYRIDRRHPCADSARTARAQRAACAYRYLSPAAWARVPTDRVPASEENMGRFTAGPADPGGCHG